METLVLIASPIAIAALVALNALIGGWRRATLASLQDAERALREDLLTFEAGEGIVSADGRAALVVDRSREAAIGLVVTQGDRLVTRLLTPGPEVVARLRGDRELLLRMRDFTFPGARLILPDEETARRWADKVRRVESGEEETQHA